MDLKLQIIVIISNNSSNCAATTIYRPSKRINFR